MVVPGVIRYLSDPCCVCVSKGGSEGETCMTRVSRIGSAGSTAPGVSAGPRLLIAEPGFSGTATEVISRGSTASDSASCNSGGGVEVLEARLIGLRLIGLLAPICCCI